MNRSRVPIFRARAFALVFALSVAALRASITFANAAQAHAPDFWFAGTRLILEHPQDRDGEIAVATDDDGLERFLLKIGASMSFAPAQRYIVFTAGDRRTLTFTIGDAHIAGGNATSEIPFAPYAEGNTAYVPFLALAHALGVEPVRDGPSVILQPQLGAVDVAESGGATYVTLHAAGPIKFKRISDPSDARVSLALLGVGTSLAHDRPIGTSAVAGLALSTGGTVRNPTIVVTVDAQTGVTYALAPSASPNSLVLEFGPSASLVDAKPIPNEGLSTSFARSPEASLAPASRAALAPAARPTLTPITRPAPVPTNAPTVTPSMAPGSHDADSAPGSGSSTAAGNANANAAGSARLTSVDIAAAATSASVHLALTGTASYEWHRLPDNRWYLDLQNATLATAAREQPVDGASLTAVRVKQFATNPTPIVRVALQLAAPRAVAISGDASGITLAVGAENDPGVVRVGSGNFGAGGLVANAPAQDPLASNAASAPSDGDATPAPPGSIDTTDIGSGAGKSSPLAALPEGSGGGLAAGASLGGAGGILAGTTSADAPWKFAGPGGVDKRLIVIDPGHGGSDAGSAHNGLTEKDLTLDMSKRLKDVLEARGWHVRLTRSDDRDVFAPNDSAHDELQARDDVANNAGARLFISIHVNAFTDSGLNGTTTYYYKSTDLALARAIHRRLIASLGTADDGVQKANYYVIHHADAPAALIETAFDSNPSDAALLASPAWRQKVAHAIADGVTDYVTAAPADDSGT